MTKGWISIHRQIMKSEDYLKEKFTRIQAWIDLLLLANYEDSYIHKRGIRIKVCRGQIAKSMEELAERWQWSRGKVNRYLNELEMEQQIVQQKSNLISLISIVNYSRYQDVCTTNDTTDSTTNDTTNSTTINNKYNNIINNIIDNNNAREKNFTHEMKENSQWLELMSMRYKIQLNQLLKLIEEFELDIQCRGEKHSTFKEAIVHFNNWLIKKKDADNRKTDNKTAKEQRDEEFAAHIAQKIAGCRLS